MRLWLLLVIGGVALWAWRDLPWVRDAAHLVQPRTASEQYQRMLADAEVGALPLAAMRETAAQHAVSHATAVTLPHRSNTSFDRHTALALGIRVSLRRGQRLEARATADGPAPAQAFLDIYTAAEDEGPAHDPTHAGGGLWTATYDAPDDRDVIVRVQPELLRGGDLRLDLRAGPSLRFPVAGADVSAMQSRFGAERDGGRRRHEGVDIFAPRGTEVVAVAPGIVTRVSDTGIGGRVVWVWNPARGLSFYYAHLDEQKVTPGTRVDSGTVVGTVGNTGNARTTPPHLHFGIYELGRGAIDPLFFIAD